MIYLDHNATTALRPAARDLLVQVLGEVGNPSSVHAAGRLARSRVETAREQVAQAAQARPDEVIFTAGGSEANALAVRGVRAASCLVSATSHDSVLKNAPQTVRVPVQANGLIDLAQVARLLALAPRPALLSVEWVNNETGVIQPVAELLALCQQAQGFLHLDGVQALGRVPLQVRPHLLTLSAHKVGGAQGVGALIVQDGVPLEPLIAGGGQERGRRAGTENVAGIAAFGAAAQAAIAELPEFMARQAWREAFEQALCEVPGARIIGQAAPRVANTTCVVCPGPRSELLLIKLDLAGIAASSGAACSSGKVQRSHVLAALGLEGGELDSALRFSFGWTTTPDMLKKAAECWTNAVQSAISSSSGV